MNEYSIFKRVMDLGDHPAFIGKDAFSGPANNGGALGYEFQKVVIAVSLVNPHFSNLIALNVLPDHRGHGLGGAIVKFLMPNFARVLESKVEWFEKLGYVKIGKLKRGISLNTQLMARGALFQLAGRLQKIRVAHSSVETEVVADLSSRNQKARRTKESRSV